MIKNPYIKITLMGIANLVISISMICVIDSNVNGPSGWEILYGLWAIIGTGGLVLFLSLAVYDIEIKKWDYLKEEEFDEFIDDIRKVKRERDRMLRELDKDA